MCKKKKKVSKADRPSPVISQNRHLTFSVVTGAKKISYENGYDKNGKQRYKYIPNTKVNRDEIDRLKGKAEKRGHRLIWW